MLRLSRSTTKRPQVVTTNFDTLFERADRTLGAHVPPGLPDLASIGSFDGVVYELGAILETLAKGSPNLRDDPRWKGLNRIAESL